MSNQSPKVQIENVNKLPAEKIIQNERSLLETEVIDSNDRVYKLALPSALDELDFYAALGRDQSSNIGVLVMTMPLIFIESIDGASFTKPNNYQEIRAAIKRIGKAGMDAISKAVQKYQADSQMSSEDLDNIKK